jgi:hypothetical protein
VLEIYMCEKVVKIYVYYDVLGFWKYVFCNCRTFKGGSSQFGNDRKRGGFGGGGRWRGNEKSTNGFGGKKEQSGNLHEQNWELTKLQPFTKDLYQPHPAVENR